MVNVGSKRSRGGILQKANTLRTQNIVSLRLIFELKNGAEKNDCGHMQAS